MCKRWDTPENAGCACPLVFVVHAFRVRFGRHKRDAGFLQQLDRLLIHAQDRDLRIRRQRVRVQDVFPMGHELGIGLGWDHPVLNLAVGPPIFFSV